jgi:hypothetical protein
MKKIYALILPFLLISVCSAQIHKKLNKRYSDHYLEEAIQYKRFNHVDLEEILAKYQDQSLIKIEVLGQSVEGRNINLVQLGTGQTKVFLWSQMHGNESTATMALFDIFNFFIQSDELDPIRNTILSNCTLYFIPMVNPDGADRFERRNSFGFDINRDAVRLQSPEAQILMNTRNELNPEYGFNLHDQGRRNGSGRTGNPASISFLAPAFNYEKDLSPGRENAMKLIVHMNKVLQKYMPGHVGKYSDEFEPRAFGDNFQKLGTNTILIESGWYHEDDEKQFLRKMNFLVLIESFYQIAIKDFQKNSVDDYFAIPNNRSVFHDIILRNVQMEKNDIKYLTDISFGRTELENSAQASYFERTISDLGDLSVFFGFEDLDCTGYHIVEPQEWDKTYSDLHQLAEDNPEKKILDGFAIFHVDSFPDAETMLKLPIRLTNEKRPFTNLVQIGANPVFYLADVNHQLRYIISNGRIFNLGSTIHIRQLISNSWN